VQNKDRFKTILVIVIGLLTLSYVFKAPLLGKIAFGVGAVSIIIPITAKWIEWAWLKLALGLGWINSRILLTVVYFVFLLPIAWISKLFTKDPLKLRARGVQSLYENRDHLYTKEDLENIW
jgi:saxitoxin biosynthesis operon SxtJ-like protein